MNASPRNVSVKNKIGSLLHPGYRFNKNMYLVNQAIVIVDLSVNSVHAVCNRETQRLLGFI
jgi:hypothetical protein